MEKRLLLAFLLTALVLSVYSLLVPPAPRPVPAPRADSAAAPAALPSGVPAVAAPGAEAGPTPQTPARTVVVRSPLYEYRFSTRGAALTSARLEGFASYVRPGEDVQLVPAGASVLSQRVAFGADTFNLAELPFEPSTERVTLARGGGVQKLTFRYASAGAFGAEVTYTFRPETYLVDVEGRLLGTRGAATLLTDLGTGLAPHDAREHAQGRELMAVGWNRERIERLPLRKVRSADTIPGPLVWAGLKDRYFLVALVTGQGPKFTRLVSTGLPPERYTVDGRTEESPRARTWAALPVGPDGRFAYQAYLGPQEHDRLVAVGHELEEVNPYGYRWLRPVVRPIAAVVLWVLKEMHAMGISYGWVLVIFGVMMRVVLWPLNAKAMRAQMRNMAVQPQLQARMKEVQEKYRTDPAAQQRAMIEVYRELGVSPFSMMSGCLPMLIPMPVLITLFFVFQSAIEFRGASFAWLPDLSLKDPFFILPVFLVVSMFALQWVSTKMSGIEQNPQMKMMMYMMPLMMGAIFWALPSGLNLYYATTNVASLPQQILIAQERRKAQAEQKAKEAQAKALRRGSGPPRARPTKRKG